MPLPVLGIDISKKTFDAALLWANGKTTHRQFANHRSGFHQLTAWLKHQGLEQVHACLEATGIYGDALARFLFEAGHLVSVVNPRRVHAFAESELQRTKTDRLDAGVIARFCQAQRPQPWSPPPPELVELQGLVRRLEALEQMRQQELNRLEAQPPAAVRSSIAEHLQFLETQIRTTKKALGAHLDSHPHLRSRRDLLVSIIGIAQLTAAKLLAGIPQIEQFSGARQVAAFVGLTPRQNLSGSSLQGRPRLSRIGSARLRRALYMPALVAMRYNPVVRAHCRRLSARGKAPMAIVGAAMRKLVHLAYGVLKTGTPFNPCHHPRASKSP